MSFWKKTLNMQVTFALWFCLHAKCDMMYIRSRTCLAPVGGLFTNEHSCALPCPGLCSWRCGAVWTLQTMTVPTVFSPEAQHLGSLETEIQCAMVCSAVKPGCPSYCLSGEETELPGLEATVKYLCTGGSIGKQSYLGEYCKKWPLLDKMVTRNSPPLSLPRKRTCKVCHTWCTHLPTGKTCSITWTT